MGHPRLDGDDYYTFVDEWVTAVHSRWPSKFLFFMIKQINLTSTD